MFKKIRLGSSISVSKFGHFPFSLLFILYSSSFAFYSDTLPRQSVTRNDKRYTQTEDTLHTNLYRYI
jgi:hypothetical protein